MPLGPVRVPRALPGVGTAAGGDDACAQCAGVAAAAWRCGWCGAMLLRVPVGTPRFSTPSPFFPHRLQYITLLFTDLGVLTPAAVSDELIQLYV